MRRFKARLVYKGRGRVPCIVDIDEHVTIRRSENGVVCEDEVREHQLGVFDYSMSGGDGNTRIFWEDDRLYIQDLGSYNGTHIEYDGVEEPIKGWKKVKKGEPRDSSEKVPIKKTRRIKAARTPMMIEIEPVQTIIEHTGSGDVHLTEVAGDFHSTEIHDSVINRSNIGTVSKGIDEEEFKKTVDWLDGRNQERSDEILSGQLEIKGLTRELQGIIEMRFNELLKELPYPASIEKKKMTILLTYQCSCCGEQVGTLKDRKWKKWLMLGVAGAMVGIGIATFGAARVTKMPGSETGARGLKRIFYEFTGKNLSDIPAERFMLTNEERDKLIMELREQEIITKLNYCPVCNKWVCGDCFDREEMMCTRDAELKGW